MGKATATMKAAVRRAYGPPEVLRIEDVQTPTPADDEVLIRVHAASVNLGDWELLTADPLYTTVLATIFAPRPRHPVVSWSDGDTPVRTRHRPFMPKYKILGCDVAGRVEAVGGDVIRFRPGDEVFGDCGISGFGAFAEYVCVPEKAALVPKPPGMSFEQAAAIPQASFIAVQGLRDKAEVKQGMEVLINGAGGGAGTFSVQLARAYGAEVTAVDGPSKLEMLRSLGADYVLDYTRADFTRNGLRYDVILDLAGYRSVFETRRSLTPDGIYLWTGGGGRGLWQSLLLGPVISRTGKGRVKAVLVDARRDDLTLMAKLFQEGKVVPVIDRCYPLSQIAEALQRIGDRLSRGKIIITP
jgi:NADPH:quinone reductase-like Zn-dependent oxidoreductase